MNKNKPFDPPTDPPETFDKLLDRFEFFVMHDDLTPEAFFAAFTKYDLARLAFLFSNSLACAQFLTANSSSYSPNASMTSTPNFYA